MLIGRTKELIQLKETTTSEYSSFVAIYGRRRVGKTFLVREAFDYDFTFQHSGLYKGTREQQLAGFASSLTDAGLDTDSIPSNWLQAFDLLKDLVRRSRRRKKVIFIDELSWMDTPKSDLMLALESFWNGWASARKDIVLIVCASATSWMMKKVIHNKGGLYNRLTLRLRIQPFDLAECEEMVSKLRVQMTRPQIAEFYMVAGGIPYYWTKLNPKLSLAQNIDALYFNDDAPFKEEYRYLFSSIFDSPEPYLKVINALVSKKGGLTREEIVKALSQESGGTLTGILDDLESCGFIRKYNAYGNERKGALYQLIDNFVLFYHKFMKGRSASPHYWSSCYNSPSVNTWRGLAFEMLCLEHTAQIKKALGISGIISNEYSWSCRPDADKGINGAQIDLMIDRNDATINVCEMKYYAKDYTITKKYEGELINKITDFRIVTGTKKAIQLTLVTTYGITANAHSDIINSVVVLDDLFA